MRSPIQFFFAWAAFVFLPVNMFAGATLARDTSPLVFISGLALGLALLALTIVPAVLVAVTANVSFSGAMMALLPAEIARPVVGVVPIVNLGWFSIQLAALGLLTAKIAPNWLSSEVCIGLWALICAAGPLVFGYRWLSMTGALALIVGLLVSLIELSAAKPNLSSSIAPPQSSADVLHKTWLAAWAVYGTWAFSSASCVMDLARFSRSRWGTVSSALAGLVVADICLIGMGYYLARSGLVLDADFGVSTVSWTLAYAFFIAGLWSTNDSNIYSTAIALRNMGARAAFWPWLFVAIAAVVASVVKENLFGWIGRWLILMGWIAVPLSLWWWYILWRGMHLRISSDMTGAAAAIDPRS